MTNNTNRATPLPTAMALRKIPDAPSAFVKPSSEGVAILDPSIVVDKTALSNKTANRVLAPTPGGPYLRQDRDNPWLSADDRYRPPNDIQMEGLPEDENYAPAFR